MNLRIRPEISLDHTAVNSLIYQIFGNDPLVLNRKIHVVAMLRQLDLIPVSLVALVEDKLAGTLAFSPLFSPTMLHQWYSIILFGVSPEHQRKGIGSALMTSGLNALKQLNAGGVIAIDNSRMYNKFNFIPAYSVKIKEVPSACVQTLSFLGSLPAVSPVTLYPTAVQELLDCHPKFWDLPYEASIY